MSCSLYQVNQHTKSYYELKPLVAEDTGELQALLQSGLKDSSPNTLYEAYSTNRSGYFVLKRNGKLYGGVGFAPLKAADAKVCELQKMYLDPQARGKGFGKALVTTCLDEAIYQGYSVCYLQVSKEMTRALKVFQRMGFEECQEQGSSDFEGCDIFMKKNLCHLKSNL